MPSSETQEKTQAKAVGQVVAAAAAAAILALDLTMPFGTAVPMLYAIPLLVTWFVPGLWITFVMMAITMAFTLGGTALSSSELTADVTVNRTMASALLLVIGWLVIKRKRLAKQRDADQAALRESEERFGTAFNDAAIGMGLVALDGRWLKVNQALCDLVGYAAEELEATAFQAITHPDDLDLNPPSYQQMFTGAVRTCQMEKRYVHKQGHIIWVIIKMSSVRNSDGTPRHFITQIQDISERKLSETALREREERFRMLAETMPHFVWQTDNQGEAEFENQRWYDYTGLTHEMTGHGGWLTVQHPDDAPRLAEAWRRAVETGGEYDAETRFRRAADGTYRWFRVRGAPVRDAEGRIQSWVGTCTDIHDRKEAEMALRQSEERLRLFVEYAPAAIAMFDREMKYLAVSRRFLNDYYVTESDVIGRSHYDVFPDIPARWREYHRRGLQGEVLQAQEDRYERTDGTTQWLHWEIHPWHGHGDEVGGILIFAEEITERKQAEAALRQSEARFRTMAEAVPSFLFETDADGWNIWTSEAWCRFTGQTPEQVSGHGWAKALHPDDAAANIDHWTQCIKDGVPFEAQQRLRRHDGIYEWVIARALPVLDSEGNVTRWIGSVTNVDDIVRVQEALRESEERFAKAFQASPHPLGITEVATGRCIEVNEACLQLFGYRREEVIGNTTLMLGIWPNQEDRARLIERMKAGEPVRNLELSFRIKSGELRHILVSSELAELGGTLCLITIGNDITERKQAEDQARRTAADLAEAQRVAKLGSWRLDIATDRVWLSDQLYEVFDVEPSLSGEPYESFLARVHPDDRPGVVQANVEARASGRPFDVEFRILTQNGSVKVMREIGYANRDADGRVLGLFGTVQDITDRKLVEEALRKAESYYRTIFLEAGVGVAQIDSRTGQFLRVNRKYSEMVGLTEDELLATTFMAITHPDDLEEDLGYMERLRRGELSTYTMEKRYVKKDGSTVWVIMNVASLWQAGEMPTQHIAAIQDITARKLVETALRESEERFRHIFEYAGTGIAIIALTGRLVRCNPAYSELTGYSEEELAQYAFPSLIHQDDCDRRDRLVAVLMRGEIPSFRTELRYLTKSGSAVWVQKLGTLLRSGSGKPTHYIVMVTNVTDQKESEERLRVLNESLEQRVKVRTAALAEANERWGWVVRATNDGIWDWDLVHNTAYFSPRWKEMHGFQERDLPESAIEWRKRIHPEDRQSVLDGLELYLRGEKQEFRKEYRIRRKDGAYFWVLDRGIAVRDEQGRAVRMVGAESDITWQKEAEEALRRREHEFRTLADNVPAHFSYIDRDRRYQFINKRCEELFGRSDEELKGVSVRDLLGPGDYAKIQSLLDRALAGESGDFDYRLESMGDGTRYFVGQYVPDIDANRGVLGVFVLMTDVTALKASEALLRERETQLRELGARLLRAQEEERRRISRDLHDDVMQRMGALALELYSLAAATSSQDAGLHEQLKTFGASAEQLTTDLQRMAHQLHPSILEFGGLETAVREQVNDFSSRTGLSAKLMVKDVPKDISLDHATCLYRVLQEALQNVQKHAEATTVLVRLLRTGRGLGLCILDDGRGIELGDRATRRKGMGLTSMAERVGMLNGSFRIRTKPDEGMELHAWVPLEDVKPET